MIFEGRGGGGEEVGEWAWTLVRLCIRKSLNSPHSYIWAARKNDGPYHMSQDMRKCVLCHMRTSAQSDQRLCCSLPRQNGTSSLYIRNFKILAGLCS